MLEAEAAGENHFRTILLWHSQGRRKGDPKHTCCGKKVTDLKGACLASEQRWTLSHTVTLITIVFQTGVVLGGCALALSSFFPQHLCFGSPFLRPCGCHNRIVQAFGQAAAQLVPVMSGRNAVHFVLKMIGTKCWAFIPIVIGTKF